MSTTYFLTSERIGFRDWNPGDTEHAVAIWQDSGAPYMGKVLNMQQIRSRIVAETRTKAMFGVQIWPIFLKDTSEFIGCCGLSAHKPNERIYNLDFFIVRRFRGRGLASEAVQAVLEYAFNQLGAAAVSAKPHTDNIGTKGILTRAGFLKDERLSEPEPETLHPYYILESTHYNATV